MENEIIDFAVFLNDKPLEEMLTMMTRYGKPYISLMSYGWLCVVKMHVAAAGITFDVQSEFDHPTPSEAAKKCLSRIKETLNMYGEKA